MSPRPRRPGTAIQAGLRSARKDSVSLGRYYIPGRVLPEVLRGVFRVRVAANARRVSHLPTALSVLSRKAR